MHSLVIGLLGVGALALAPGCGGKDEGILLSVTRDPAAPAVDGLHFVIGVEERAESGVFLRDATQPDVHADMLGIDLITRPYKLLLHDGSPGGEPTRIQVAVLGLAADDTAVAFGALDPPQAFMPGRVVERGIPLTAASEGSGFTTTPTGCVKWDGGKVTARDDRDCDGDPSSTDCDDADPARSNLLVEVCDNGVDDDCDPLTPDICGSECMVAADCAARGAPPCGAGGTWECKSGWCDVSCPGCTDADRDGYGVDLVAGACAGPDCDDALDTIGADGQLRCYRGPMGTAGIGVCRTGAELCVAGVRSGPCSGEVTPAGEACNDEDDDCDGMVDEDLGVLSCGLGACFTRDVPACTTGGVLGTCVPGPALGPGDGCDGVDNDCDGAIDEDCPSCVRVAPNGNDATGNGGLLPFRSVQKGIDAAVAEPMRPRRVCVAHGITCASGSVYPFDVQMADGISVYGNYESTTWTRCSGATMTVLRPPSAQGVRFGSSVASPTVLDGFRIDRASAATTAAVTLDGARNVILSDLTITNNVTAQVSYGVDLKSGAEALITRSLVTAGTGTVQSAGVHSLAATPTIRENCPHINGFGRCDMWCDTRGIRGQDVAGAAATYAVLLEDSPGAVIETTALCRNRAASGAVVRVVGDGSGIVVRASRIDSEGGQVDSHGIWLEDCGGASPWIVDNDRIWANGDLATTRAHAVHAVGDCHPVIDSNVSLSGAPEGSTSGTIGVYCGAAGGRASRCTILGNTSIQGALFGNPPYAVGVRCDDGACLRIADNDIDGSGGSRVVGLALGATGTLVERNRIEGGCGLMEAIGVAAQDSFARLENNRIFAGTCQNATGSVPPPQWNGVRAISTGAGAGELDLHSNVVDGGGFTAVPCFSIGLRLEAPAAFAGSPRGVYRNNIVRGGVCSTRIGVKEAGLEADPRRFENNDLDPTGYPVLYRDEDMVDLGSAMAVNALAGAAGNISVDPQFVAWPTDVHLKPASMCIGRGTAAGAPTADMDGDARDPAAPDIGADEWTP